MDEHTLIKLDGVGKDYAAIRSAGGRLRLVYDLLRHGRTLSCMTALDAVSLEVRCGESMGIIGENGAGKSTLLKIIAGVVRVTRGSVVVRGRVMALLELGAGFHPDYSGAANIELAGALFGLTADEIAMRRDSIIEFADIGSHIDDPIKTYSSGMVVRLGFAIVTAVTPDVLITDEVLAVGDEPFQRKCVKWIDAYLEGGGTLLLCSHSMYHVQKLCAHALWLRGGRVHMIGPSGDVAREYLAFHEAKHTETRAMQALLEDAEITVLSLRPAGGGEHVDATLGFEMSVETLMRVPECPVLSVTLHREGGTLIYGTTSAIAGVQASRRGEHHFGFALRFSALPLLPGHYYVLAWASSDDGRQLSPSREAGFVIAGTTRELGYCRLNRTWNQATAID